MNWNLALYRGVHPFFYWSKFVFKTSKSNNKKKSFCTLFFIKNIFHKLLLMIFSSAYQSQQIKINLVVKKTYSRFFKQEQWELHLFVNRSGRIWSSRTQCLHLLQFHQYLLSFYCVASRNKCGKKFCRNNFSRIQLCLKIIIKLFLEIFSNSFSRQKPYILWSYPLIFFRVHQHLASFPFFSTP